MAFPGMGNDFKTGMTGEERDPRCRGVCIKGLYFTDRLHLGLIEAVEAEWIS